MRTPIRIVAGMASLLLVVGGGAGLAQAAQTAGTHKPGVAGKRGPGGPPGATAIAEYLGLTAAQLRTQLQSGKSLADVAKAQDKSVTGLADAIVADAKKHLDAAVTADKLTATQAADMLTRLKEHVDEMINSTGPPPGGPRGAHGPGHGPVDHAAVAEYLGLTAAQLKTQLRSGKSLAQIATAQNKTVSGLEDTIVAAAKKKLDAAVTAGKLTAAHAATMLTRLQSDVSEIVERSGPPPRGMHGPRGMGPGGMGPGFGGPPRMA